ncbi:hypothetical protein, partial [Desulfobulbus sp.]|uniref:hypothetical protein n=1 Tax=Desulfobulbus sp. TaxID=895 RepID=UPI00286F1064
MRLIAILCILVFPAAAWALAPRLAFSDLDSGPKTGNTDGKGSGAIVTIWGNNLGASQGAGRVYVGEAEATAIYYWKNADGQLPGGPADLYTYHKMQEIAFAIPTGAPDGATTIRVRHNGVDSNTLPFFVRPGNIRFIKTGGDNTGTGLWNTPWASLSFAVSGAKIVPGDIVYSVGVGASSEVDVGASSKITGTATTKTALVAYPGTTVACSTPTEYGTATIHNNVSGGVANNFWTFSKLSIDTGFTALSIFGYARYIGLDLTGNLPSANQYSGAIGGNCTELADATACSGHRILGAEIHDYGDRTGANNFHHVLYISNRSPHQAEAYEIGWSYFHNNTAYQGIHIYDQNPGVGWRGTFNIHDNVIHNFAGNAINLNAAYPASYNVYNNLIVLDPSYSPPGGVYAQPAAAFRIEANTASFKIFNNTVYGYAAENQFQTAGTTTLQNNIIVDTRGVAYASHAAPTKSN